MAIYNEILVGRYNRALQKLFGIKGTPPVRQVAGEIQPSYPLGSGEEDRWLQGWNTFWASTGGTVGNAGNSPVFRMTNDVGSNIVAVIEKLLVGTVAATLIDVQFANQQPLVSGHVPNLTILPTLAMDGRILTTGGSGQGNIICSTSVVTNTLGQLVMKRQAPAGQDLDLILFDDQEWIMTPQSALNIFAEAAASTMFVSVQWRERYLEDSERS